MGGTSQPWMGSQQPQPDQSAQQPPPATGGYSADISSSFPAAYPINGPAPGSFGELENVAGQAPQQLGQALQTQQQQQPQQQPGQWSPENPHAKLANYYSQQLQQSQPQTQGGGVKRFLSNFFVGMGSGMMHEAGLPTDYERQQVIAHNAATYSQLADNWEQQAGLIRYRSALTDKMEQDAAFQRQLQPLQLQALQQGVEQGAQNIQTIRPSMTAADLASLGIPGDLATTYAGHPLTEADMSAVKQLAAANQKQLFDTGEDGPNKVSG